MRIQSLLRIINVYEDKICYKIKEEIVKNLKFEDKIKKKYIYWIKRIKESYIKEKVDIFNF